MVLAN